MKTMMKGRYRYTSDGDRPVKDGEAGSIGDFGRMRFAYLRDNRPDVLRELISERQLRQHLKKADARGWEMMREIERSMKQSSEVLRNKKDHSVIEIMVERRQIRNTAYNFVRKEYICR